jgi:hypothetical protein
MLSSGQISVHAVVRSDEVTALGTHSRTRVVGCGPIAAVVSSARKTTDQKAALRHGRIIGTVAEACSSVVPFRLGVEVRTEPEIREVLKLNAQVLVRHLDRFRDRVEMGIRAKVASSSDFDPSRMSLALDSVRSFAEKSEDRQEALETTLNAHIFKGCYLIPRGNIDKFWLALETVRKSFPAMPLMGSGPWAPYSFCDFVLRPPSGELRGATQA